MNCQFSLTLTLCMVLCHLTTGEIEYNATCVIAAHSGKGPIHGNISFRQTGAAPVVLSVLLEGFDQSNATMKHGFHVHQNGNLSSQCDACGSHFNPNHVLHGDINDDLDRRHVGDLGNVDVLPNGTVQMTITDKYISLHGNYSIIGRSIVVHEQEDDLGRSNQMASNTTGNSGARLGCCTIALLPSRSFSPSLSSQFTLLSFLVMLMEMMMVM